MNESLVRAKRERLRKCVTLTEFSRSSREVNASRATVRSRIGALKLSKSGQPSSSWSSFLHTAITEAKMQNGSSKTGRGVTVNGTVSTLKRQPRLKTASGRQEHGSCSSTASCPVFSGCQSDLDEEPQTRCPFSLSSPTLHKPGSTSNLKCSISSLQGSLSSLKGSVTSLKSFPTSSTLRSSSPSLRSSSPSLRSSSEDDSWDTNSWSSGATCLLRSSIKQHSEEVFRVRAGSASRPEGTSDSETGYQNSDSCQGSVMGSESQEGAEQVDAEHRDSSSSQGTSAASTASSDLEQKIEEKLKFSQFLDEVSCRVLKPECLQAFGAPIRQKEPQTSSLPCLNPTPVSSPWFGSSGCDSRDSNLYKWAKCMPSCKILDASETLRRTQEEMEMLGRTYLETDIDRVRREDEVISTLSRDVEKRTLQLCGESSRRCPSPVSKWSDGAPRPPYRTTSLPRPAASGDMSTTWESQHQKPWHPIVTKLNSGVINNPALDDFKE
ncbi:hypothetical protein G5714_016600 [Onychostoma macrolepis]|uniref:Uncharacterized protein n=1 Tax=Onychostoma macrolepis TaxID=369639 RepID=A0A7J6C3G6_9TELE|nr:hypothetical protein G5714_016600 [Onychostoma macrolepis]